MQNINLVLITLSFELLGLNYFITWLPFALITSAVLVSASAVLVSESKRKGKESQNDEGKDYVARHFTIINDGFLFFFKF